MLFADVLETPVGNMVCGVEEDGALTRLGFLGDRHPEAIVQDGRYRLGDIQWRPKACRPVREQVEAYFRGELQSFSLPIRLQGSVFRTRVWEALQSIPYGQTATYSDLARQIGAPLASRAVGAANGANPIAIVVPCHRVIGADGSMTGYASGVPLKRFLLQLERSQAQMELPGRSIPVSPEPVEAPRLRSA